MNITADPPGFFRPLKACGWPPGWCWPGLAAVCRGCCTPGREWAAQRCSTAALFDNHRCFRPVVKPSHGQALVAERVVEALRLALLPRLAGVDQGDIGRFICSPAR
jgi:hypothetical protein